MNRPTLDHVIATMLNPDLAATHAPGRARGRDGKYAIDGDMDRLCKRCGQPKRIHDAVRPFPVEDLMPWTDASGVEHETVECEGYRAR